MTEIQTTSLTGLSKAQAYEEITRDLLAVLDGEPNQIARMATCVSLLAGAFDTWYWTGFYLVDADKQEELVIGPYSGTLGCLRIAFGRGVCGTAATTRTTQIVADVHAIPNHIACDSRSNSEIVVPVLDKSGALIGVFDVDSEQFDNFDETDRVALEKLMKALFGS